MKNICSMSDVAGNWCCTMKGKIDFANEFCNDKRSCTNARTRQVTVYKKPATNIQSTPLADKHEKEKEKAKFN